MKPLGPDDVPDLIDGKVSVFVYVRAHPEKFFQYPNKTPLPSKTSRYRIASSKNFLDRYNDEMIQGYLIWLDPGELEDENGNLFTIQTPNAMAELFPEEGRSLVPATLPMDWFYTAPIESDKSEPENLILYKKETPLNLLLNEFLNANYQGGLPKFVDWLTKEQGGQWLEHSDEYLWGLPDGTEYRKSKSQVKSQLTKLKKRQRELLRK